MDLYRCFVVATQWARFRRDGERRLGPDQHFGVKC
jgi:hypothetical protein